MAEKLTYHLARSTEGQAITVFIPGRPPKIALDTHPKFKAIRALLADDAIDVDEFMAMFESKTPLRAIGRKFEQLSDRVTSREGKLFFDGDEIHNTVSEVILGLMTEGKEFMPVVRFMEKLNDNPQPHSREQAYRWISSQKLTITENGDVVGYKGAQRRRDGILESTTRGKATVDGIEYIGNIPYPLGSVAMMPRSTVVHDPNSDCSTGLHVGTHSYAQTYGHSGAVLEVHVNPRDIVSVPRGEDQKMRVCRLRVVKEINAKYTSALRTTHAPLPPTPDAPQQPVDDEFADCVMCATCGECQTHGECICEEAARQQTDLDAENATVRARKQSLIRKVATSQGFDWEPEWSEGPNPVATFGTFRVLEDEDGIAEGDEGTLTAEVVGDPAYHNEGVSFSLGDLNDGRDEGYEVDISNVEYVGALSLSPRGTLPLEFEEPEGDEDEDEDEVEDELSDDLFVTGGLEPIVAMVARRFPTDEEFEAMKARAKRRRQNFVKYAKQTGGWTLVAGDGNIAADWILPADPEVVSALEQMAPESTDPFIQHPSKSAFAAIQVRSKTRRRPIRSLVSASQSINWTLIEGDGTKREHWSV